jgi:HPt (histidine-containing phosphotransfer) domain-containing protein
VNQDNSQQVPPLETGTPDEQFEELRQRFQERLRKEQRQLATLTQALGNANAGPPPIFADIREFAHRLRGAALVFGFQEVGAGAKAVELAAIAASLDANGPRRDPAVVSTMQALAITLAAAIDTGALRECI